MKRLSIAALSGLAIVLLLSGCFIIGVFIDPSDGITVLVGSETYAHEATYDFGMVDATADPVLESAELVNVSSFEFTVTAVTVDSEAFTVETPDLPFTMVPGDTVEVSVGFAPVESGVANGTITVQVDRTDTVFELNLTGDGNYPPVAQAVTVVTGAGSDAVNGTYVRGTETQNGYPVYRLAGTDYRIYGEFTGEGIDWFIDDDLDSSAVHYFTGSSSSSAPTASNEDWLVGSAGTPIPPSSLGEIQSDFGNPFEVYDGDTVSPNYVFVDPDGDDEGSTTYQWYSSDSATGTYAAIPGATSREYTVGPPDDGLYLKVLVTPRAATGIELGEPVWFGPSPSVFAPS